MNTELSPRKLPRQSRSQATVGAILDATARVLVERGFAGTTTNAVAEIAGVSVGSLYQYFPNKAALVAALHERHRQEMLAVIEREFDRHAQSTLEVAIAGVVEAVVEAHRVDGDLHRALGDLPEGDMADQHDEMAIRVAPRIRALLQAHRGEIAVTDLKLATYMLMHTVHGLVHAVLGEPPAGISRKAATREIARVALGYLGVPPR